MPIHGPAPARVDSLLPLLLYTLYFVTTYYIELCHVQPLSRGDFPERTSGGDRRLDPSLSLFRFRQAEKRRSSGSVQLHFPSATRSGLFLSSTSLRSLHFPFPFFLYILQSGCQVDVVRPIEFFPPCYCRSDTTTHLPPSTTNPHHGGTSSSDRRYYRGHETGPTEGARL